MSKAYGKVEPSTLDCIWLCNKFVSRIGIYDACVCVSMYVCVCVSVCAHADSAVFLQMGYIIILTLFINW